MALRLQEAPLFRVELVDVPTLVILSSDPADSMAWAAHERDRLEHLPSSLAGRTMVRLVRGGDEA